MPAVLVAPSAPDPDDRDRGGDYLTEDQLHALGIDPALVLVLCPWATELRALDGSRCWWRLDLESLLEGNS